MEGFFHAQSGEQWSARRRARVAATMFRWMLPTRPRQCVMATDGKAGRPGRLPKGLVRLVHNCE